MITNNPKLLDNTAEQFQLKSFLSDLLISGNYSQISIATGYWDLLGMLEMLPAIEHFFSSNMFSEIRFLIGEEPKIRVNQLDTSFPEKYINSDLKDLPFKPEYQEVVKSLIKYLESAKIKVKLFKRDFLHAKCYIIGTESENAIGIIGSSNFTRNGLMNNTELNDIEYDHRIVNYIPKEAHQDLSHRSWFEKQWNDDKNIDWNEQFKIEVLGLSKFGNLTYSPYEIYIKILYEIYGEDIEIEERLKTKEGYESRVDLTLFQEESKEKVLKRLDNPKIGMCLLGDSVGLGKSYIAKHVIERFGYFERKNVVVVCPASLRDDWKQHLQDVTVNAPVYSITEFAYEESLKKIKDELQLIKKTSKSKNAIDLLVIDESHNLKTQGSKSFQNILKILTEPEYCKTLPRVLMLSATPVNNGIKDLVNQILLAKGCDEKFFSSFGIPDIQALFSRTQREFIAMDSEEVFADLYPILNKIMVKRTKHRVKKDFPNALLDGKPIIFPEELLKNELYELDSKSVRAAIRNILNNLEKTNNKLYYDFFTQEDFTNKEEEQEEKEGLINFFKFNDNRKKKSQVEFESIYHFIDRAIKGLKLIPYSYLNEKIDKTQEETIQANARKSLTGVMKVSMFKSFDSSVHSFNKRIDKYNTYLNNFEELFFSNKKIVKTEILQKAIVKSTEYPDEDVLDLIFSEIKKFEEREFIKKEKDKTYKIRYPYIEIEHEQYNIENIKIFIQQDKDIIELITKVMVNITEDTKLQKLQNLLKKLKGKKVLIFSYFATTVDYLKQKLDSSFLSEINLEEKQTAFLKSSNSKNKQSIVRRFSPKAQKQSLIEGKVNGEPEIQILCSTDVLSEGQNLQDCGIIINYDLHWNPVKMVQRNGRINRLGSEFKDVYIYNFRPEDQLDKFLKLMKKLQEKIRIIGSTVGLDSSVLGEQITEKQFGLIDDIYSNDKVKQRDALESLERENELAFDEIFENDLREFMRKASDSEKDKIKALNYNKWCCIPTLIDNNKLMAFNIGEGEFDFIRTDGIKVSKESNQLKALRQIRSFDEKRQIELLSFDEKQRLLDLAQEVFKVEKAARSETIEDEDLSVFMGVKSLGGGASLVRYKEMLLELLKENIDRYSKDYIERIRRLLTSKNLAFDNRLRSYIKKYDNQISIDFLDTLAILSINLTIKEKPQKPPEPVLWFGYYASKGKND